MPVLPPRGPASSLVRVGSRRWFLEVGLAGLGGLSLPQLLAAQQAASQQRHARKSVILFWLSGGPSHIDMWDPKPEAPQEIRGPYGVIPTKLPGVQFCEHLPLQASIADKGYDSNAVVAAIEAKSMRAVIPSKADRAGRRKIDSHTYKERHLVQNFFSRIKH